MMHDERLDLSKLLALAGFFLSTAFVLALVVR
jgi:hypothetical protein